jgi:acyl-coenzyme A synthetase/AMP-(fatty) acid ligase
MQFPNLAECLVIGTPDDKWGEAVHAIVAPRQDKTPDPAAIIAGC